LYAPDPIKQLVSQLHDASAPSARADDSAVRRETFPSRSTIGPAPQRARVAPDTFSGYADVLASLGNGVANGIASRRQTGLHSADYLTLATLAAPVAGGFLRAIAPAAEAAPDAELAARQFYSTLPGLVQSGGAMSPATHARALETLVAALPKAAATAAPVQGDAGAAGLLADDWLTPIHPAPADPYAGIRPAAESMEIPANLNKGALADSVAAHGVDKMFAHAGSVVDGRTVGEHTPNLSSIGSTFGDEHTVLPGVREVSMHHFNASPKDLFYAADDRRRVANLAQQIKASGRIDPLIVAVDKDGPYVLEGAHRLGALHTLGAKSFPAVVVQDGAGVETAADAGSVKLYHGSPNSFDKFDSEHASPTGLGQNAHYFSDNEAKARVFGDNIKSISVPKSKLLDIDSDEGRALPRDGSGDAVARTRGYLGLRSSRGDGEHMIYDPNQFLPSDLTDRFRTILNATANAGQYKPDAAARAAAEMQRRAYSLFQ